MKAGILIGLSIIIGFGMLCGAVSAEGLEFMNVAGSSFAGNGISFMSDSALTGVNPLFYSFSGSGINGDVSSFFNTHSMAPNMDFAFSESSSASGIVNQFSVSYSWTSSWTG